MGRMISARQAVELMQAGRFQDAEILWRHLQARSPNDPAIHSNLGVTLAQQGQFEAATAEYRKSLSLSPKQPEVAFDLGVAEFKQGHFSQAIPAFKTVAKLKPEDVHSTLLLGISYYGLRQYASATPYLQRASQSDPSNLELHNVLAQSCLWSQKYDCALTKFKSILRPIPMLYKRTCCWPKPWTVWERRRMRSKNWKARPAFLPTNLFSHSELGYLYFKKGDYDKALPELQMEVKNNPGYAQAYLYLGDIALRTNDDGKAEPLITKAMQLQKDLRLAYFDLGRI